MIDGCFCVSHLSSDMVLWCSVGLKCTILLTLQRKKAPDPKIEGAFCFFFVSFFVSFFVDIPDRNGKILTRTLFFMFYLLSKTHRTRCPTVPPGCGAFFLGKLFNGLFSFNWRHSGKINIRQVLCWLKVFQTCEVRDIFDLRY